jgi:lysophospholipase L1-like esterase
MKTIVCYGDSNTWGFTPKKMQPELKNARHPRDVRWPGRLQTILGPDSCVVEAGLNGRTTVFEDPIVPNRNGLAFFAGTVLTQAPVDLVIVMLGVNDAKTRYGASASVIAKGMERLIADAQGKQYGPGGADPEFLIAAPPPLRENITETWIKGEFTAADREKALALPAELERSAHILRCHFLDAGKHAQLSENDGIHMDAENHAKLADAMARGVLTILGK